MNTPDFWLTEEGKAMHERLAKLAGWTESGRYMWAAPIHEGSNVTGYSPEPPPASTLIRQLESGMTEEQRIEYGVRVTNEVAPRGRKLFGDFAYLLITASDETRARAICEAYAAKDQEK